jgi:hypothetical protein
MPGFSKRKNRFKRRTNIKPGSSRLEDLHQQGDALGKLLASYEFELE